MKLVEREIFTSESGGSIVANYKKSPPEEKENVAALKAFAEKGSKVVLRKADNKMGVRTADCTIDGISWEVKTNRTATVSAIDNALHSCHGQSKNLVLNITSGISTEQVEKAFWGRVWRTNLEKITVERNGVIERVYQRCEFIKE